MTDITITTPDNETFSAYVAKPENAKNAPALIVIQEIFGVNAEMRRLCDMYAAMGYVAICPDLFWRLEPGIQLTDQTQEEWDKAFDLFGRFDVDKGVEDLKATLAHARKNHGKVGCVGYCLGGKLAYLMATRSDCGACVSYYGVDLVSFLNEAASITKPLLLHVAEEDKFVPKDQQDKQTATLKDIDDVSYYTYAGVNHAFARQGGEHYDEAAATLAEQRTRAFLEMYLTDK